MSPVKTVRDTSLSSPISFKKLRKGFGKVSGRVTGQRCSAPPWSQSRACPLVGSPDLDRLPCHRPALRIQGSLVLHDAWYWLPLMFILYGGRSSELVALPLKDVHEQK